jgi:hypothetical protein
MRAATGLSYSYSAWREPLGVAETPPEYVIHRPRLYLDTTIPSYLTAWTSRDLVTARLQRITTRWWNSWRTQFEIHVSDIVLREADAGDPQAALRRLAVLERFRILESDGDSRALSARIIEKCGLPARASVDAEHVALAAMNGMDFLLTWNCAHLVNPQIASKIALVCRSEGYYCPTLCTPEQLMEKYEHVYPT